MGFFSDRKKKEILDLTRRRDRLEPSSIKSESSVSNTSSYDNSSSFFDLGAANSNQHSSDAENENDSGYESPHERKRKLAKRLVAITDKLEELSNQIYHLQQRVELLERKLDIRRD